MGGCVGVDSRPGEGSRFWFTAKFQRTQVSEPGHSNPSSQEILFR
jgi:hypothetical protein